jgi:hypothetical protein
LERQADSGGELYVASNAAYQQIHVAYVLFIFKNCYILLCAAYL